MFVETRSGGEEIIFAENRSVMIEIKNDTYASLAEKLAGAVGCSEYFNGSISCSHGGFDSLLTATILVYRRQDGEPEGNYGTISDIVPVWWEFSTVAPDGSEPVSGFCFSELKKYFMAIYQTSDQL